MENIHIEKIEKYLVNHCHEIHEEVQYCSDHCFKTHSDGECKKDNSKNNKGEIFEFRAIKYWQGCFDLIVKPVGKNGFDGIFFSNKNIKVYFHESKYAKEGTFQKLHEKAFKMNLANSSGSTLQDLNLAKSCLDKNSSDKYKNELEIIEKYLKYRQDIHEKKKEADTKTIDEDFLKRFIYSLGIEKEIKKIKFDEQIKKIKEEHKHSFFLICHGVLKNE